MVQNQTLEKKIEVTHSRCVPVPRSQDSRLSAELVRAYMGCYCVLSPESHIQIIRKVCSDFGWSYNGVREYFHNDLDRKTLPAVLLGYFEDKIFREFNLRDPNMIYDIGSSYWQGNLRDMVPIGMVAPLYDSLIELGDTTREELVTELAEMTGYKDDSIKRVLYPTYLSKDTDSVRKSLYYHIFQELGKVLYERLRKARLEGGIAEREAIKKVLSDFPFDPRKMYSLYDVFWVPGPRELGMVLGTKLRESNENRGYSWEDVRAQLFDSMIVWLCPSNRRVRMVMDRDHYRGPR